MMRIVCANWSRRHVGGIESYLASVVPALQALGHEVAFWAERDGPEDRVPLPLPLDVPVWCAARDGLAASLEALRQWHPSVLFVHGLVEPAIERRLVACAPAVMLAHSYYGTCISGGKTTCFPSPRPCTRVLGPSCLAHFYPRRCGGLNPVTMLADYRRQLDRLALLRRYDLVLTLSAHMASEYRKHGLSAARVRQLPRYVPDVASPRTRQTPRDPALTLLFLGRMDRLKGCAVAIEALPLVQRALDRPVRLVIAGDGPDRARCERLAGTVASGSVRIDFGGWVSATERDRLLAAADVLVFPSLWPEPYGLAGLEAVASGVPVAAFGSGAVGEWLQDGVDGALASADPPTAAGLAQAVARCAALGRQEPWTDAAVAEYRRRHFEALSASLASAAGLRGRYVVA